MRLGKGASGHSGDHMEFIVADNDYHHIRPCTRDVPFGSPLQTSCVGSTLNTNIDGLLGGLKWRDYIINAPITYSFTDSINDYDST